MPLNIPQIDREFQRNVPGFFNPSDSSTPNVKGVKIDPMTGQIVSMSFAEPTAVANRTAPTGSPAIGGGVEGVAPMFQGVSPNVPQVMGPPAEPRGFLGNIFSSANTQPNFGLSRLLATIGASVSAQDPNSWQNQLSKAMIGYTAGQQAEMMRGGNAPTGLAGFGITPEERAAIAAEALGERRVRAEEARLPLLEQQLGIEKGRAITEAERVGKMAPEETAEERRAREEAVAKIGAGARQRGLQLTTRIVGDEIESGVFDPDTGTFTPSSTGPRYKDPQSKIPAIGPTERQDTLNVVFEQIKSKLPKEGFLGFGGRIEPEDLDEMILKGALPKEAAGVMDLINAYDVLRFRRDIAARATNAPEELQQRVVAALAGIGYGAGEGEVQPEGTIKPKW